MKNIEKYPNTKDALKEYNSLGLKNMPFDKWLEYEYKEPREPTLLEAAEAATEAWFEKGSKGALAVVVAEKMCTLASAIKREKRKPLRNFDKYKTADEASKAFTLMCDNMSCQHCPYNQGRAFKCKFAWLYAEAGKKEK